MDISHVEDQHRLTLIDCVIHHYVLFGGDSDVKMRLVSLTNLNYTRYKHNLTTPNANTS